MTQSQPIDNLSIDGVNYVVDELPEDVQVAIQKYEDWRERFAVAQDEVQMVSAALRDLANQIVRAVQELEANAAQTKANETTEEVQAEITETEKPVEKPAAPNDTLVVNENS